MPQKIHELQLPDACDLCSLSGVGQHSPESANDIRYIYTYVFLPNGQVRSKQPLRCVQDATIVTVPLCHEYEPDPDAIRRGAGPKVIGDEQLFYIFRVAI